MSKSAKKKARAKHRRQMTRAGAVAKTPTAVRPAQVVRAPAPPPRQKAAPARRAQPTEAASTADAIQRVLRPSGLPNVFAIARRDLTSLFVSPVGWVVAGIFTFLVSSFGFYFTVIAGQQASMDGVFGVITTFLVPVLIPLLTMRLLAEERGQGTLELLLTSPVRDWELTLGKWLGGLAFYVMLLAITLVYVGLLRFYRSDLDFGLIAATYLGLVLVGAAAVAIGLLMSSLTRNQIIAFFLAMIVLLVVWYAGYIIGYFVAPPANLFFSYVGGFNRYQTFTLGEASIRDILYWVSLAVFALFMTERLLSSRRWR
ncbi:MAG TPA: ABC transporter permease subunit [Candidatus Dormibacteraeota bacterium]|nr:ABC transporter permease subunit [Candidatus Dormibacteraeota bacterium]